MALQISIRESGDITVVDLQGRATIGVENDLLSNRLRKLVADGVRNLLMNLADVTQVDSSSIGTIAETFLTLSRYGGSLKLLHPRGRVRVVLDVTRLLDKIPSFDDEAQALASFRPQGTPLEPEGNFGTNRRLSTIQRDSCEPNKLRDSPSRC